MFKLLRIIPKKWLILAVIGLLSWGWQQIQPQAAQQQSQVESNNVSTSQNSEMYFDQKTHEYVSKAGLRYGKDPSVRFDSRIDHVMAHTKHDLSKRKHSVFVVKSRKKVLQLLDEAWGIRGSPGVQRGKGRGRDVYVIKMKNRVGEKGQMRVKMVVESGSSRVITAYPY